MKNISLLKEKYKQHVFNLLDINTSVFNFVYDVNLFRNSKSIRFLEQFYRIASKNNSSEFRGLILLEKSKYEKYNKNKHYISFIENDYKVITADQFKFNNTGNKLIQHYSTIYSPFEIFVIKPNISLTEENLYFLIEEGISYKFYLQSIKEITDDFILENLDFIKNSCIDFYLHPLSKDIYLPISDTEITNFTSELSEYLENNYYLPVTLFDCLDLINQKVHNISIKEKLYFSFIELVIKTKYNYSRDLLENINDFFKNEQSIIDLVELGYFSVRDIFYFNIIMENFVDKLVFTNGESTRYGYGNKEKIDSLIFKHENKEEIKEIIYDIVKYKLTKSNNKYNLFKMNFCFNGVLTNIHNISDLQPNIFNIIFEILVFEIYEKNNTSIFRCSQITNNKLLFLYLATQLNITKDDLMKNYDSINKIDSLDDVFENLNYLSNKDEYLLLNNLNILDNKILLNEVITKLKENNYEISLVDIYNIPEHFLDENIKYLLNLDINKFNLFERFYSPDFTSLVIQHISDEDVIIQNFTNSLKYIYDTSYIDNILFYYESNKTVIEKYVTGLLSLPISEIKTLSLLFKFYNCLSFDTMFEYITKYSENLKLDIKIVVEELLFNLKLPKEIVKPLVVKYFEFLNSLPEKYDFIFKLFKYNDNSDNSYYHINIIDILNHLVDINVFTVNDTHILIHKYYKENRQYYNIAYFKLFDFSIKYYYFDILLNLLHLEDKTKYLRETRDDLSLDNIYTIISSKNENIYHLLLNPNENLPFRKREFNEKVIEIFMENKWNLLHLLAYITYITPPKNSKQLAEFVLALHRSKNFNIINNFNHYTYINLEYIQLSSNIDLNITKTKKFKSINHLFGYGPNIYGTIVPEYIYKFNEILNKVVTSNKK
jgi:hypothetical protein